MGASYEFQNYPYTYPRLYDRLKILNDYMEDFLKNDKNKTARKLNFWKLAYYTIGKSKKELKQIFNLYIKFMAENDFKQTETTEKNFYFTNPYFFGPEYKTFRTLHEVGHLLLYKKDKWSTPIINIIPEEISNVDDQSLSESFKKDWKYFLTWKQFKSQNIKKLIKMKFEKFKRKFIKKKYFIGGYVKLNFKNSCDVLGAIGGLANTNIFYSEEKFLQNNLLGALADINIIKKQCINNSKEIDNFIEKFTIKYQNELKNHDQEKILEKTNEKILRELGIEIKPVKWWNFWQKKINKQNAKVHQVINDIHNLGKALLNTNELKNKSIDIALNLMIMETLYESEVNDIINNKISSDLELKIQELEQSEKAYRQELKNNENPEVININQCRVVSEKLEQNQETLLETKDNVSQQYWPNVETHNIQVEKDNEQFVINN